MTDWNKLTDNVVQCRSGGMVERGHAIPHHGSYNNARHSWGVAMLMWYLWPEDFPRLAIYCLSHDVPEAWVGDVPAPTMRYVPGLREALGRLEDCLNQEIGLPAEGDLCEEDHRKLKACDRLELYMWCREQLTEGNSFVAETLDELERYFEEQPLLDRAKTFLTIIRNRRVLPKQAGVMREACR